MNNAMQKVVGFAMSLAAACSSDDMTIQGIQTTDAGNQGGDTHVSADYGSTRLPKRDCSALIKNETLKIVYADWRAKYDEVMNSTTPAPLDKHDKNASMCSMVGAQTGSTIEFDISRDGEFAGHVIKPEKPNISFRVALEENREPLDVNHNVVPINKVDDTGTPVIYPLVCHELTTNKWKVWDLYMDHPASPNSNMQYGGSVLTIPCDPTAVATAGNFGCWSYEEDPSPPPECQPVSMCTGCGGGGDIVDRDEAMALIKCIKLDIQDAAKNLCL